MRPKTEFQKRVVQVNGSLRDFNEKYFISLYNRYCEHIAFRGKGGKYICGDCGKEIVPKPDRKGHLHCPECGHKLKLMQTRHWSYRQSYYVMALDTHKDLQIFRYYLIDARARKNNPIMLYIDEVFRVYLSTKGDMEVCAKLRSPFPAWHYSDYICYSDIELRQRNRQWEQSAYHMIPYAICGGKKILPILKELGFTGDIEKFQSIQMMAKLLQDSRFKELWDRGESLLIRQLTAKTIGRAWQVIKTIMDDPKVNNQYGYISDQLGGVANVVKIGQDYRFETLWKLGYNNLIRALSKKDLDAIWPALRICFRNNYQIRDTYNYIDYIKQLIRLNKDIHNAYYVCPEDLRAAHHRTNQKIQKIIERERYEQERAEMEKQNAAYIKRIKPYLNLDIHNSKMCISVLPDVQAFYEEGKAMHHCVYTNGYYKRAEVLILSCRDKKNNRLATIEISLTHHRILQVRAACNKVPEHYRQIVNLLNKNMTQIMEIQKQAA